MLRMPLTGVGLPIQRLDAHRTHQRRDVLATDGKAVLTQQITQHARAGEWMLQVQLVDASHDCQVLAGGRRGR